MTEKLSVAQRVASRLFAAEASIDRAIADTSRLLSETMDARRETAAVSPKLDRAVNEITDSVAKLVDVRRTLESSGLSPEAPGAAAPAAPKNPLWRPNLWFGSLAEIHPADVDRKQFGIELAGLIYACDLTLLPEADTLYVTLHTFADRLTQHPPFFWGERRLYDSGHVLRISDPSLFLNDALAISSFLGPERQDPLEGVLAIARHVASRLGIREEQIVYWGTSGGGVAALRAATLSPKGRAVGINAQLDASRFDGFNWARPIKETFRKGLSFVDIAEAYPIRARVAAALKWALRRGHEPKLLIVQNDADESVYNEHFAPFCREFGLDPAASAQSANVKTLVYHNWRGHSVLTRKVSMQISQEGLPFLLGKAPGATVGPLHPSWWNELFYLRRNLDVAEAVRKGRFRSGLEHYQLMGAAEKRSPAPVGPE